MKRSEKRRESKTVYVDKQKAYVDQQIKLMGIRTMYLRDQQGHPFGIVGYRIARNADGHRCIRCSTALCRTEPTTTVQHLAGVGKHSIVTLQTTQRDHFTKRIARQLIAQRLSDPACSNVIELQADEAVAPQVLRYLLAHQIAGRSTLSAHDLKLLSAVTELLLSFTQHSDAQLLVAFEQQCAKTIDAVSGEEERCGKEPG